MDSRHAIEQAVFDINFDSADTAVEQQHELAGFIRDRLLPLAEEIFGELSERGSVSKIDQLEIDLGDIRYDGYREEMAGRFRERLRAVLQDKLREIAAAPSAHEYTVDRASAEGELLQHFLETGNLARGARGGAEEFERMLLRNLSSSGRDFAAYLRRTSSRATVVGRMARQFPRAALSAVLRLLEPEQAARLEQLADEHLQAQLRERPQAAAAELVPGIWEALLHELLQGDGSGAEAGQRFTAAMRRQLPAPDAPQEPVAAKLLAARLAAALYGGSVDECAQLWGGALSTSPETLRAVFAERLGEMRTRHRLAVALPYERLRELAACVTPQHGNAISALLARPEAQAMLAGDGKVLLWERVLAVLHDGGTDREHCEQELQAILMQPEDGNFVAQFDAVLAAGDAQELRVMLKQTRRDGDLWPGLIRRSDASSRRRFAELLRHDELLELAARIAPQRGAAIAALFERAEARAMLAGDGKILLWERVLDALHSGSAFEPEQFELEQREQEWSGAVQQTKTEAGNVSSQQPVQQSGRVAEIERRLRGAAGAKRIDEVLGESGYDEAGAYVELLQRLRSGEFTAGLDGLEADELAILVRVVARSGGAQPDGDFERGVERQARLAPDARSYYREVLRRLLDGEAFDLERAAQAAAPMSGDALLQARLEAAMVQGQADALQESWAMLLRDHPALVRATFMRHMGDERQRRKLASGFPQSMLRQLLQLLAPRQGGQMLALLDEMLRVAVADSGAGAALQEACWDYTFACLHAAEESALEIDDYARGLVRRLATLEAVQPIDGEVKAGAAHRLLQRLQGRAPQDDASGDIGELSGTDSAGFGELLRRLRGGELSPGLSALGSGELRQFAVAIVRLNGGAAGAGFIGEIEKYARQARDVRRYYLHVAECLLYERIVDLEQALAQAGAQQQGAAPEREPQGSLRHWLGQLLARTAAGPAGLAPERTDYVRAAFLRIMADGGARRELLSGRSETRMAELVAELQPAAARIAALLRGSAAGQTAGGFWVRTLEYLHAVGCDGFDARAYLGRVLAFDGDPAHGDGAVAAGRLAPDEVRALLDACAEEAVREEVGDAESDPLARLHRLLRGSGRHEEQPAAASSAVAAREATLRARFASVLDTGAAQEMGRWWDELRTRHADMARAVLLERTADAQACANIAAGLPESMLAGLLELAAPGMGTLAGMLADRLRRQGCDAEIIATLWRQSLASLETEARGFSAQRYGRGLAERLAAMGVEPGDVLMVTEVGMSTVPERDRRQAGRAARLLHIVGQRLAGHLDEEVTEQLEELAASHRDVTRELLRQLRAGDLDCDVARLTVRESERLIALFAELEVDGVGLMQQQRGRLEPRALLERLIGGRRFEPAMARAEAGMRSGESLRPMFETALAARDAQALQALWRQNRKHAAELGGFFREALADVQDSAWLAGWLPQDMLLDLAGLLQPRESRFIAALSALPGLVAAQQADAARAAWSELTLEFLGTAGAASGRAAYARAMVHRLAALGLAEETLWQEIVRADEAPGTTRPQAGLEEGGASQQKVRMPQVETMGPHAAEVGTTEQQLRTIEPQPAAVHAADDARFERGSQAGASDDMPDSVTVKDAPLRAGAGTKSYDEIVRRLRGAAGATPIDMALDELEAREPRAYAELLERLQSGELAAVLDGLQAGELERLVDAVARYNGAPPGGDFARSIERHAQLAADLAGYYREVLRQLIEGDAVDLELAANGPQRPPVPAMTSAQAMMNGQEVSKEPVIPEEHAMSRERAAGAPPTSFEFGDVKRPGKVEKELYIANAGLVLVAPYLPHLFGRLGLTTAAGFSDAAAAERAVHLTQFVVNESCDSPEFLLPLNRMLCGIPENQPIVREIHASDEERKTVEEMLKAIIAAWKVIGNTSVAGLRESFLQRAGRLSLMEDGWHLEVEKNTLDVLLDQLPWSFAVVKYSWMPQPLYVEWR